MSKQDDNVLGKEEKDIKLSSSRISIFVENFYEKRIEPSIIYCHVPLPYKSEKCKQTKKYVNKQLHATLIFL